LTKKNLNYRLQYVLVKLLAGFFYLLPASLASDLGALLGALVGCVFTGASRRARRQIASAFPELDPSRHAAICRGMWRNLGRVVAEYSHLPRMIRQEQKHPGRYFEIHDEAGMLQHSPGQYGAIFASAHFGNWEVNGAISGLFGLNSYAFGRPLNNIYVERLLVRFRESMGLRMLAKGTGQDGVRRLLNALREGAPVGMLVDQAQRGGVHSTFFGQEVRTSPAFISVAYHLDVPVFPVLITRLSGCRFRIDILPRLELPDSGDREADIAAVVRGHDAWLEGRIRQHPEQWLWLHRRWKTWPRQEKREAERRARRVAARKETDSGRQ
jgi:Kdo2-lipid IVA lauroyltransferase/acyltransferase